MVPADKSQVVMDQLMTLMRAQRRTSHSIRKVYGIGGRQLAVLRYLVRDGPRCVGEISRHLWVRDATTSPMLERMERAGVVQRHRSVTDNRRVIVQTTDAGAQIAAEAPLGPYARLREGLPKLADEELDALVTALDRLIEIAEINTEHRT